MIFCHHLWICCWGVIDALCTSKYMHTWAWTHIGVHVHFVYVSNAYSSWCGFSQAALALYLWPGWLTGLALCMRLLQRVQRVHIHDTTIPFNIPYSFWLNFIVVEWYVLFFFRLLLLLLLLVQLLLLPLFLLLLLVHIIHFFRYGLGEP